MFRRARYRDLHVSFTVPLEAMGLEVYDRVAVEHWLPRWHASSSDAGQRSTTRTPLVFRAALPGQTRRASRSTRIVTLESDKTYQLLIVRCDDGTPSPVLTINEARGPTPAGTSLSLTGQRGELRLERGRASRLRRGREGRH
jgi:hypothetical protein